MSPEKPKIEGPVESTGTPAAEEAIRLANGETISEGQLLENLDFVVNRHEAREREEEATIKEVETIFENPRSAQAYFRAEARKPKSDAISDEDHEAYTRRLGHIADLSERLANTPLTRKAERVKIGKRIENLMHGLSKFEEGVISKLPKEPSPVTETAPEEPPAPTPTSASLVDKIITPAAAQAPEAGEESLSEMEARLEKEMRETAARATAATEKASTLQRKQESPEDPEKALAEKIAAASTLAELYAALDAAGSIEGSKGTLTAEQLKDSIEQLVELGKLQPEAAEGIWLRAGGIYTRRHGLRDKVEALYKKEVTESVVAAEANTAPAAPEVTPASGVEPVAAEVKHDPTAFESTFAISQKDLETVPGYKELSEGQQALVQERFRQIVLGKVKEEATLDLSKGQKEGGRFSRLWKGITKNYQLAKLEKASAEKLLKGGVAMHHGVLEQLVAGTRHFNDEAVLTKDGKLEISYVGGLRPENPEQEKTVKEFDEAARALSKIPAEWGAKTATTKQRKAHKAANDRYIKAKNGALALKQTQDGDKEAALWLSSVNERVTFDQLISAHPEAEQALDGIADKSLWAHMLKTTVTERGLYFAGGYVGRALLVGAMGFIAAPAVAFISGGIMAGGRAKDTLRERAALGRQGVKDKSKTAENMVSSGASTDKLTALADRIQNETDEEKRAKLVEQLLERIDYTSEKVDAGKMDFGGGDERLAQQLALTEALGRAVIVANEYERNEKAYGEKLAARVDKYLNFKDTNISKAQQKFIRDQWVKGAFIGAGFGAAGALLRHFTADGQWFSNEGGEVAEGNSAERGGAALREHGEKRFDPFMGEEVVPDEITNKAAKESVEAAASAEGTPGIEIAQDSNAWNAAKELAEQQGLSKKEFAEAWSNSKVKLPDGREISLSELDLVHEGDVITYVPGKNGTTGTFEFLKISGIDHSDVLPGERVSVSPSELSINEVVAADNDGLGPTIEVTDPYANLDANAGADAAAMRSEEPWRQRSGESVRPPEIIEDARVSHDARPERIPPAVSEGSPVETSQREWLANIHPDTPEFDTIIDDKIRTGLDTVFGGSDDPSRSWNIWRGMSVRHVLDTAPGSFTENTPGLKLQQYLQELIRETGTRPRFRLFGNESVEEFIVRAQERGLKAEIRAARASLR